jgi:hypothetical protein
MGWRAVTWPDTPKVFYRSAASDRRTCDAC